MAYMNYTVLIETNITYFLKRKAAWKMYLANPLAFISTIDFLYIDKIRPRLLTFSFKFDGI